MREYVKKYKFYVMGGALIIIVGLLSLFIDDTENEIIFTPISETKEEDELTYIYIDIKGEIKNPGVYKVVSGSRLFQVVSLAGGVTSEADELAVNFALQLSDEQVIYIPNISDDYPIITENNELGNGLININTASLDLLDTLPGIGPTTAQSIISYRLENGAFTSIEDLLNVPGIGEGTLSEIRNLITV
ncbi:MAG: helix-hairpin-helix domain-containing protein [Bacilli bacterium]|nr:helix-hairpin-helix domain-containing protein [Bacilli bacterium]